MVGARAIYEIVRDAGRDGITMRDLMGKLYADPEGWSRKAILNIAASGKFSSDRTIAEYAKEIWGAKPCPVESD